MIFGVPLFSIFSGYGFSELKDVLKIRLKLFYILSICVISLSSAWWVNCYFLEYPKYSTHRNWRYGIKEAILYTQNTSNNWIIVSNKFYYMNIFILFYTQYDPSLYQRSPIDPFLSSYSIGKYHIIPIANKLVLNEQCLLIIKPDEIQQIVAGGYRWHELYMIKNPTGEKEILIGNYQK